MTSSIGLLAPGDLGSPVIATPADMAALAQGNPTANASHSSAQTSDSFLRAFLEHLPPQRRAPLCNAFHAAARAGHSTPEAVVNCVRKEAIALIAAPLASEARRTGAQEMLIAIQSHYSGALAYAAQVLARHRLPEAERQRFKEERSRTFAMQQMEKKPPTERQLGFLASLGYDGPPPCTKGAASRLIDELKRTKIEAKAIRRGDGRSKSEEVSQ